MGFLAIFLLSSPALAASSLDVLEPGELAVVKAKVESILAQKSGHPILCSDPDRDCIVGYERLLTVDWSKATLDPGKKIVVSVMHASSDRGDYYLLNPVETGGRMERFLGADPGKTAALAAELPNALKALDAWNGRDCPGLTPADVAPKACAGREKYYDELFKSGALEMTVVRGYQDEHQETISGIVKEQFLHTKKVPVSLADDQRAVLRAKLVLVQAGFKIDRDEPNRWTFSRTFYYKGEPKVARVNLVTSLAACPGDQPMDGKTLDKAIDKSAVARRDDELCPAQKAATLEARKAFAEAFGRSQFIVYDGHARLGHGPDFGPLSRKEGKFSIADGALDGVDLKGVPTTLVLAACKSLDHFEKAVQKKQKSLADPDQLQFIGTTADAEWGDEIGFVNLLRTVMEAKCPSDLPDALNIPRSADFNFQYKYGRRPTTFALPKRLAKKTPPNCDFESDKGIDARSRRLCSFGATYIEAEGKQVCVGFDHDGNWTSQLDNGVCDRLDEKGYTQQPTGGPGPKLFDFGPSQYLKHLLPRE